MLAWFVRCNNQPKGSNTLHCERLAGHELWHKQGNIWWSDSGHLGGPLLEHAPLGYQIIFPDGTTFVHGKGWEKMYVAGNSTERTASTDLLA